MNKSFIALVILLGINSVGLYYDWYLDFYWFDILLHFLGGFFMALFLAGYLKDRILGTNKIKDILIIVGAAIFIGVAWEFCEYIANIALTEPIYNRFGIRTYFMGDIDDTMTDLMLDIFGALLASFVYLTSRTQFTGDRH